MLKSIIEQLIVQDEAEDEQPPEFQKKEAEGKFGLISGTGTEAFQPFIIDCFEDEWTLDLPSIVGEESGEQFSVKADLGRASQVLLFN